MNIIYVKLNKNALNRLKNPLMSYIRKYLYFFYNLPFVSVRNFNRKSGFYKIFVIKITFS